MKENLQIIGIIIKVFLIFSLIIYSQSQPTPSDNCLVYNSNSNVCQQCVSGFYLQYYFCLPCNPRCQCQSRNDFCQECSILQVNNLNFLSFYDQSLNQCILCNQIINNCLDCQNSSFCTKCFNGMFLIQQKDDQNIGNVTVQYCSNITCQINCQICSNHQKCKLCQTGFYLINNKTCSNNMCIANCQTCNSSISCQICQQGFYLEKVNEMTVCNPCILNCSSCSNGLTCDICGPSFNLVNNTCSNNGLSNCVSYAQGFTVCLSCQPGYQVSEGSCNQCTGCNYCIQQFICTSSCQPGYYQFNFACLPIFQLNLKFTLTFLIFILYLIF